MTAFCPDRAVAYALHGPGRFLSRRAMLTDYKRTLPVSAAAILAAFVSSCGGSSPAGPSPQPPPAAAPAPTLSAIAPALGATTGGVVVTITGTGFVAGAAVTIGGAAATGVAVASATSITATTPAHAAGAADIVVTNPDGQSGRLTGGFRYEVPVSAPPSVSAVGPSSGPVAGGTGVSITGAGFATGATVSFGPTPATAVNVASATSINATAPAGSPGSVDVVVTNPDGQSASLLRGFTYVASAPPPPPPAPVAPTITAIAPLSGTTAGGTTVTFSGTGFAGGATVSFGGTAAASVVVVSATSITATTPARAAGAVDVAVTNTDGLSGRLNGGFTFTAPVPPPPPPPAPVVVVTITSAGTNPSTLTIAPGTRVRFVNNDTFAHDVTSDPHPAHTQCPPINQVGLLLPGQARETAAFTTIGTCGYHDHTDPDEPRWTGTIQVR